MLHRSALRLRKTGMTARVMPDTVPHPVPTSIDPPIGSLSALAPVTIAGSAFLNDNPGGGYPVFRVTFDDVPATSLVVVSDVEITCTTPAGCGAAPVVRVFSPGGDRCVPASVAPVFDPATLNLSLWQRDYAGVPWVGTASAGASGADSLDDSTGASTTNPASSPSGTGHDAADLNGTSDALLSPPGETIATLFGPGAPAGSIAVLFKARTAATFVPGTPYNNPQLFQSYATGYISLNFTDGGVQGSLYDGSFHAPAPIACSTGAWRLAQMRWDGVNLEVRVDGGAWTSQANGPPADDTERLMVGAWFGSGPFFDGLVLEVMTSPLKLADADFDNVRSYLSARYGVTV